MIRCRSVFNITCLKCADIPVRLVRIGVFYMCQKCFEIEFNDTDIEPESENGKNYYRWLKYYNEGEYDNS